MAQLRKEYEDDMRVMSDAMQQARREHEMSLKKTLETKKEARLKQLASEKERYLPPYLPIPSTSLSIYLSIYSPSPGWLKQTRGGRASR